MFKKIIAILALVAICATVIGCGKKSDTSDETSTPQQKIEQSVLVRPNTNEDFRYNVYTYYVEISECLSTKTNIVIPDTIQDLPVYKICSNAFNEQTTFSTLVMTNNIIEIGENAFGNCTNLTSVTLSNNLETLGAGAFAGCENLKKITIPSTVLTIPADAFSGCARLMSVNIEESVSDVSKDSESPATEKIITGGAFAECPELKAVWIPKDVTTIEDGAFTEESENIVICGVEESAAATYAAVNLLDFKTKAEFDALSLEVLSTQKKGANETVLSPNWKLTLSDVFAVGSDFDYVTNKKSYKEVVNENENIVFASFTINNLSGQTQKINILDFEANVDGYKRKISSYGYVSVIADYKTEANGSVLNGEIQDSSSVTGCVAIKVPSDWQTVDITYKGDIALEATTFEINRTDTYINWIGVDTSKDVADNKTEIDLETTQKEEIKGDSKDVIPNGAVYTSVAGDKYEAGKNFPSTLNPGDVYTYGDYEYRFMREYEISFDVSEKDGKVSLVDKSKWGTKDMSSKGWSVRVNDTTKSGYGSVLTKINGYPIINMNGTFFNCGKMTVTPEIPKTVDSMNHTFAFCVAINKAPSIPESVKSIKSTFYACSSLKGDVVINKNITSNSLDDKTFAMCARSSDKGIVISGSTSGDVKDALKKTGFNNGAYITIK